MLREKGISRYDKRKKKMIYLIKEYDGRRLIKTIEFNDFTSYIKECIKRDFVLNSNKEKDIEAKEEFASKHNLVKNEFGKYVDKI